MFPGKNLNLIVAFCKGYGIGDKNALPWKIKEDMSYFERMTNTTQPSFVVMGRKTFFSIPSLKRPLKNRLNVVVTSTPSKYRDLTNVSTYFVTIEDLMNSLLSVLFLTFNVGFVIGGEKLYSVFSKLHIDNLYITYIDKEYKCDTFFPFNDCYSAHNFRLKSYSPWYYSKNEECNYRHLHYEKAFDKSTTHHDKTYISLLNNILENGERRVDRTGTGTLSIFANQLKFCIEDTIPLLTTKYVPWKSVIKELLWFLRGDTDSNKLEGVKIWQGNTTRDFLDKQGLVHYKEGDIGPMYGFQWRHYGARYEGCDANYQGLGIDQLDNVIHLLKTDPYSRRIFMTTVNVSDLENGCLHPCHGLVVQFYVSNGSPNKLSCHMYQRSVDSFLGLTWNILSYAILTYIIAKKVDMIPHELIISTGDTHLYLDHIDQAKQQTSRSPYPSPKLVVSDVVKDKAFEEIVVEDFDVIGYFYHPSIKAHMSV